MTDKLALTRPEAAALCGLSPAGFDMWVRRGIVPTAIAGTRRWSRAALERALATTHDRQEALPPFEYSEAVLAGPLGKRERAVLTALLAAGGRVSRYEDLPEGPSTFYKLVARGYFVTKANGEVDLRLSPAGMLAAAGLQS